MHLKLLKKEVRLVVKLLKHLYALGRDADVKRAITDEQYLAKLMKEFAIQ